MKKIKLFNWLITFYPVKENDMPFKWNIATRHRLFGIEFILWEL